MKPVDQPNIVDAAFALLHRDPESASDVPLIGFVPDEKETGFELVTDLHNALREGWYKHGRKISGWWTVCALLPCGWLISYIPAHARHIDAFIVPYDKPEQLLPELANAECEVIDGRACIALLQCFQMTSR